MCPNSFISGNYTFLPLRFLYSHYALSLCKFCYTFYTLDVIQLRHYTFYIQLLLLLISNLDPLEPFHFVSFFFFRWRCELDGNQWTRHTLNSSHVTSQLFVNSSHVTSSPLYSTVKNSLSGNYEQLFCVGLMILMQRNSQKLRHYR